MQNIYKIYITNSNTTTNKLTHKYPKLLIKTLQVQYTTNPLIKHIENKNKNPNKHTKHPIKRYKEQHVASAYRPRHTIQHIYYHTFKHTTNTITKSTHKHTIPTHNLPISVQKTISAIPNLLPQVNTH